MTRNKRNKRDKRDLYEIAEEVQRWPRFKDAYFEERSWPEGSIHVEGRNIPRIIIAHSSGGFTVDGVWPNHPREVELHIGDYHSARRAVERAFEVAQMTKAELDYEFD